MLYEEFVNNINWEENLPQLAAACNVAEERLIDLGIKLRSLDRADFELCMKISSVLADMFCKNNSDMA